MIFSSIFYDVHSLSIFEVSSFIIVSRFFFIFCNIWDSESASTFLLRIYVNFVTRCQISRMSFLFVCYSLIAGECSYWKYFCKVWLLELNDRTIFYSLNAVCTQSFTDFWLLSIFTNFSSTYFSRKEGHMMRRRQSSLPFFTYTLLIFPLLLDHSYMLRFCRKRWAMFGCTFSLSVYI
jgi:hypothetical protein